jgi:hypothetical protein
VHVCSLETERACWAKLYGWKDNESGEVDKLESSGNEVVVLGDLGNSLIGNVVTDESAARYSTHDLAELVHERNRLSTSVLGHLEEVLEVSVVSLLLTGQVKFESLAGEETIETLAEINMSLSVEENPVVVSKKLRGNVDDCGLDIGRRVEDLASHITSGSDNDKLVEDRNTAERTAAPFGMVTVKSRVHGIEEWADEGNLHGGTDNRALPDNIGNLIIGNTECDKSKHPSPDTGIGDGFDDIVDLGRDVDVGVFCAGQDGREAAGGGIDCLHCVCAATEPV